MYISIANILQMVTDRANITATLKHFLPNMRYNMCFSTAYLHLTLGLSQRSGSSLLIILVKYFFNLWIICNRLTLLQLISPTHVA